MKNKTKQMMLSLAAVVAFVFASCDRECHCYGFDGDHVFYTEQQLDEMEVVCSEMALHYGSGLFYSMCEWD